MKTIIRTGLAVILLVAISCTKEPLQSPLAGNNQTKDNDAMKTKGHHIGERYGGGVIFWIKAKGQHGLIADSIDLGQAAWYNGTFVITKATGTGIGTGTANTKKIIRSQGSVGTYAALLCAKSTRSGYTDWFLPSKDELNELYERKTQVGIFINDYYWSSSEYSYTTAWQQNFGDGNQHDDSKYLNAYVRAVRAF